MIGGQGYLSGSLSVSRFNRRLHALADWLPLLLALLGAVFATGEAFVLDICPEGTRGAGLSPGTGGAVPQGAGAGVLWLLRGEGGDGCPRILEVTVRGGW